MGRCPYWYTIVSAARYLGVPPWDLAKQPVFWLHAALTAASAEAHAQEMANRKNR